MRNLLIFFFILTHTIIGQAVEKHPRVAELEDKFKKDANHYLEARFPGLPFSVAVSIDPLRRSFNSNYDPKGEVLPFYALDEEGIQDEWDDPTASLYTLSNRVKKIHITVQVPESLNQEELSEVKISLGQILRLVPARDSIEVVKRKWTLLPNLKIYTLAAGAVILAFLIGLFLIAFISTRNVSKSLENVQAYLKSNSSNPAAPTKIPGSTAGKNTPEGEGGPPSGDIRFNDPIKIREVTLLRIDDLVENKDLLRLENIRLLDELGLKDPQALGALLTSFPIELQKEFFSFSKGSHWMEALTNPGELSMKTLEVLEALGSVKTTKHRKNWEKLLIQIWRMKDEASQFLKSLKAEQSMALLGAMPKFISLPLARAAFPGNWAVLLDSRFEFKKIDDETCKKLFENTLEIQPLTAFEILDVYKKDMELLWYVEVADIRTEQEIYEAAPPESMINKLRPPFYILFNQSHEILNVLVQLFDINDWALALFNVPREQRQHIESQFSDKEKFYYYELLQALDKNKPEKDSVAFLRTQMAHSLHDYLSQKKPIEQDQATEEPQQNDAETAA